MNAPTGTPVPQQAEPKPGDWYTSLSGSSRAFMQLGFAGLVAVMFFLQTRDLASEARANREMYREEQHALRAEIRAANMAADLRSDAAERRTEKIAGQIAGQIVELAHELRRTSDVLRNAGLKIERAAEKVGEGPQGVTAPIPRAKGEAEPGCSPR